VRQTFVILKGLVTASISPKAALTGRWHRQGVRDAARSGIRALVVPGASLSVSVGILNLFRCRPSMEATWPSCSARGFAAAIQRRHKSWILNAGAMVLFLLTGW